MQFRIAAASLDRDLRALAREVEAYADERDLWRLPPGVGNSGGTLALHLAGNLQHYIGRHLGATAYRRDRPGEFAERDVPRAELLRRIEAARQAVRAAADRIGEAELAGDFPEAVGGVRVDTGEYLVHLAVHLAYHLGQVDYHRRLVTGDSRAVDAVRVADLGSARPVAD